MQGMSTYFLQLIGLCVLVGFLVIVIHGLIKDYRPRRERGIHYDETLRLLYTEGMLSVNDARRLRDAWRAAYGNGWQPPVLWKPGRNPAIPIVAFLPPSQGPYDVPNW